MSSLVYRINGLLSCLVADTPIGTTLNLFLLLWTLISGRFLESRGAVFPALDAFGLSDDAVRRAEAGLAYGSWKIDPLLDRLQEQVEIESRFQAHVYEGYRPVAADVTGFYRPHLSDCPTKHYCSRAGKALPAIPIGIVASVGSVEGQRLAIPRRMVRADPNDPSDRALHERMLKAAKGWLGSADVLVTDRGIKVAMIQETGIGQYVARVATNFTAERVEPPPYRGWGRRPEKGEIVRPLARRYDGREIERTEPDRVEEWTVIDAEGERTLRAEWWEGLRVRGATKEAPVIRCVAIHDPRFDEPLLLVTELAVTAETLRRLYLDRWPVETIPLAAKQMLGAGRQFVSGKESRQRLPELALLAGAVLSYLAATEPAVPSGFWDRKPKRTPGRLRRVLSRVHYADLGVLPGRIRRKDSETARLPKGAEAPRRRKRDWDRPETKRIAA